MKISIISASIVGLGGAEAMVRMLANGLVRSGHEVQVISLDPQAYPDSSELHFSHQRVSSKATARYAKREAHGPVYKAWWQYQCQSDARLISELMETLEEHRPDLIHTHKVRGFPRNLWQEIAGAGRARLIHTCHDIELLSPLHTISMTETGLISGFLLNQWASTASRMSKQLDAVTSPSRFMLDLHLDRGFFTSAQARVISNFPDLEAGSIPVAVIPPQPLEPLKLVFIGRLVKVKGILALCEAVKEATERGHSLNFKIAGDGNLRREVIRFSDQHDFIQYEGVVQGSAKLDLLAWSHVVATPSAYDETFCLVAAEGISAGRPVLATHRGGLPEVVTDGLTGWVCQGDDRGALLAGLLRVIEERDQIAIYSRNCLQEAGKFSSSGLIAAYEQLYDTVINGASA